MILFLKSVFITDNASLAWLNNFVGVYLVQVSLLLIGQQGLGDLFRYRPLLPIDWRITQILRQRRRNTTNTAPITVLLVRYKQQANPLLSIFNYSPLVIIRNNKKAANIIKPTYTRIDRKIFTFCNIKSLVLLKNLKNGPASI
jgi:hypothetical protein